jgi:hypothetical protein
MIKNQLKKINKIIFFLYNIYIWTVKVGLKQILKNLKEL